LCGAGPLADCFSSVLPRIGASVMTAGPSAPAGAPPSIVLGASQKRVSIDEALVDRLPADAAIYDVGIGNLSQAAAERARSKGLRLYRLDNRAGISSAVVRLLETDFMIGKLMGRLRLKNVDFGVADGKGRFKESLDPADRDRVAFVQSLLRAPAAPAS